MIPTRNDDDEPDVIDLTTSYGYHGSLYFPIRPPSPFADNPRRSPILSLPNEDKIVTSSSSKIDYRPNNTDNTVLPSSSSHVTTTWRRTLTRLLKRSKSNKHKKVASSTTSDLTQPYNFGIGEITRTHSLTSRGTSTNKRVHWIDDDELILNTSHRFIEYLKLFVQNIIIENTHIDDINNYIKQCQISLNELDSLIDCQKIKIAFDDIIQLANNRDKTRLYEQQIYIENLISHSVLFSSA